MKTYRCAYCDRQFELSDDAVPHVRNGQYACEMYCGDGIDMGLLWELKCIAFLNEEILEYYPSQ
jgi:hypothetical protein